MSKPYAPLMALVALFVVVEGCARSSASATIQGEVVGSRGISAQSAAKEAHPVCTGGQRDDFDGATLDRGTWSKVVREDQGLRLSDGHLIIPATNTNIDGEFLAGGMMTLGENNTTNMVLQPIPAGPFVATAKLTIPVRRADQQAGLIVYESDDDFSMFVIKARSKEADEAASRVFNFYREGPATGGAFAVGGPSTERLGANYPDVVWVRLYTTDGTNLRAAYSGDGTTFIDMKETIAIPGLSRMKIGLISQSGMAKTTPIVDAKFDYFEVCPGRSDSL